MSEGDYEALNSDYGSEYSMNLDPLCDRNGELALLHYNKVAKNQDRYT